MRVLGEEREQAVLAPYACFSNSSKGRLFTEALDETRTCFQRDRDRLVHSRFFRRLAHKTQVFIAVESDYYRSRLTHSLEVAQISRQLCRMLHLNEDLGEGLALAHDLGHTPFGHAGEDTLDELMQDYGGFEHNWQSLRVVDFLEKKYPLFDGLNLSFELRAGLAMKSPITAAISDLGDYRSLEAEVVNISDQISYNNHDLDDGLSSGILDSGLLRESVTLWREADDAIRLTYSGLSDSDRKYLINSYLISSQIQDVMDTTQLNIKTLALRSLEDVYQLKKSPVVFSLDMSEKASELRAFLREFLYAHPSIKVKNQEGQQVIQDLFGAYMADLNLVPIEYRDRFLERGVSEARLVSDYIAGMTDVFAIEQMQAL